MVNIVHQKMGVRREKPFEGKSGHLDPLEVWETRFQNRSEESLTQDVAPTDCGLDKRRSTRVVQALPIKVSGVDALQEPFTELTSTVMVSCHGCKYQSKYYVPRGSIVAMEIPRIGCPSAPRTVTARVIWVQRPRNAREVLHIGLEFEVAGNVWDIPIPPDDWFPLPGEKAYVPEEVIVTPEIPEITPDQLVGTTTSWDESEILVMTNAQSESESAFALTRLSATGEVSTAANLRDAGHPRIDARLQAAIDEAVNSSITRIAHSIAEQTRKAYEASSEQLHARIKATIEDAMSNPPVKRPRVKKKKVTS
jgi:hypothetical protein